MPEIKLNLGSKIKMLREMRGISQEALAFDLGISQQAFQQIEAGKTKVDLNRADAIARSLSMDLKSLLAFQPANVLTNCTQSGVYNTNNFLNEKLLASLEGQIAAMRADIVFLQQQNMKLLEVIGRDKKSSAT